MHTRMHLFVPFLVSLVLAAPLSAQDGDLNVDLMRATVKISHEKSTATGFVLSRNAPGDAQANQFVLVTAAHVFDNTPGDETTVFMRTKDSEGVYKKEPLKLAIRTEGKPRWTKHPSEDLAAIVFLPPKGADLPRLSTDLLATDEMLAKYRFHPGDTVACLGFPHRIEANEAGFPILRNGPVASYPLLPTTRVKTFLVSTNTFEGDSGGPVYFAEKNRTAKNRAENGGNPEEVRLIVGLVTGQQVLDEELKMIYATTKVRHRLGLAIVIHASFIRETIARLP